jgi:uncharacterized protein
MIIGLFLAGFALGILGSFHCVGMCGPLALSLPVQHLQGFQRFTGIITYNFGRVITYSVLGFILGFAGMSFSLFGMQQIFSIVLGCILLLIFFASLFRKRIFQNSYIQKTWNQFIVRMLSSLYGKRSFSALFFIGLLNGLLPCGLVYMALAGGLATGNILYSGLFMASFGLGTLPAMIAMSFAGSFVSIKMRNHMKKAIPYIFACMGILLILRGMNLNIPYLSPALEGRHVESCH